MLVEAVASVRASICESVRFQGLDEFAGSNAFRDFQTVTTTAGDSISISGGTGFPSSINRSTIIFTTSWMFWRASASVLPWVLAPFSVGQRSEERRVGKECRLR